VQQTEVSCTFTGFCVASTLARFLTALFSKQFQSASGAHFRPSAKSNCDSRRELRGHLRLTNRRLAFRLNRSGDWQSRNLKLSSRPSTCGARASSRMSRPRWSSTAHSLKARSTFPAILIGGWPMPFVPLASNGGTCLGIKPICRGNTGLPCANGYPGTADPDFSVLSLREILVGDKSSTFSSLRGS